MPRLTRVPAIAIATFFAFVAMMVSTVAAQQTSAPLLVNESVTNIDLITKTSRLLQFEYDVPEMVIDNQSVVRATPIASDKVLLTALKPGLANISIRDTEGNTKTLAVMVRGDVRALELALRQFYPNSTVKATALETDVILTGTLARGDDVEGALAVAQQYFPKVINNIKLPDSQLIAIECQVYEVARTKARELGLDWQLMTSNVNLDVFGANNPTNNLFFSVVNGGDSLQGFMQFLERRSLARLMDKPTLVTMNGRPAEFLQGGELPFQIPQGLGSVAIEFRPFGTKLDVVPIVQGEGTIRLEVRAEVSEPDQALANNSGVAGFRVRRVNTGVDMKIGHTLALAGDIREEIEAETRGIPGLMNLPYLGKAFSRTQETKQEVELVILLTPRFIGEVDPSLMPAGVGRSTVSPSDCQMYRDGLIEVPRCGPDCGTLPHEVQQQGLPAYQFVQQQGVPAQQGAAAQQNAAQQGVPIIQGNSIRGIPASNGSTVPIRSLQPANGQRGFAPATGPTTSSNFGYPQTPKQQSSSRRTAQQPTRLPFRR